MTKRKKRGGFATAQFSKVSPPDLVIELLRSRDTFFTALPLALIIYISAAKIS